MPHIVVKMMAGGSDEQKRRLAQEIAKDVTTILKVGEESVSIAIQDIQARVPATQLTTTSGHDILPRYNLA